jgi:hypothetical protein
MTLRQDGFRDIGLYERYQAGWTAPGGSLDKLGKLVAR